MFPFYKCGRCEMFEPRTLSHMSLRHVIFYSTMLETYVKMFVNSIKYKYKVKQKITYLAFKLLSNVCCAIFLINFASSLKHTLEFFAVLLLVKPDTIIL